MKNTEEIKKAMQSHRISIEELHKQGNDENLMHLNINEQKEVVRLRRIAYRIGKEDALRWVIGEIVTDEVTANRDSKIG